MKFKIVRNDEPNGAAESVAIVREEELQGKKDKIVVASAFGHYVNVQEDGVKVILTAVYFKQ